MKEKDDEEKSVLDRNPVHGSGIHNTVAYRIPTEDDNNPFTRECLWNNGSGSYLRLSIDDTGGFAVAPRFACSLATKDRLFIDLPPDQGQPVFVILGRRTQGR
jgi:hypothetical protein